MQFPTMSIQGHLFYLFWHRLKTFCTCNHSVVRTLVNVKTFFEEELDIGSRGQLPLDD